MSKTAKKFPRNWNAVNAHFRQSAGDMGDKRKEQSKNACRNKIDCSQDTEEEEDFDSCCSCCCSSSRNWND